MSQQHYLPEALRGTRYYTPTDRGVEADLAVRYRRLRSIIDGETDTDDEG